jgi:DNA-directed RNA polymerase specialized sigma24 family protein
MVRTFAVLAAARHRSSRSPGSTTTTPTITARDAQTRAAMGRHLPFVWRVLRRSGLSRLEAEEAVREVFATIATRGTILSGHAELEALARTALSAAGARRRVRGPWALLPANDVIPCEMDDSRLRESLRLIDSALDELDPTDRAIFVLTELEGLKCVQVAAVLDLPAALVLLRRRLARKRFNTAAHRFASGRSGAGWSAVGAQ